jgi:cytoskeletal protein RodZ
VARGDDEAGPDPAESAPPSWYQTPAAISAAAALGLVLIAAIVFAVVQTAEHSTTPSGTVGPGSMTSTTATASTTSRTTTTTTTTATPTATATIPTTTTATETTTPTTTQEPARPSSESPAVTTTRSTGFRATPTPHPVFPHN